MSIKKKVLGRLNKVANSMGYKIISKDNPAVRSTDFVLFQYKNEEGEFDYEKYKDTQVAGNKYKIDHVWVVKDNIDFLSQYLKKHLNNMEFGLCHGTRNGKEQQWFRDNLGIEVVGTEISDTASQFPHTIQWDFHNVKDEWIDSVDFIYSNSLDHSYDPEMCLNQWVKCLKPNGLCIIEHSNLDTPDVSTMLDPFGAKIQIMPFLIAKWGKDNYHLHELVEAPAVKDNLNYLYFLVIKKS